MATDPRSPLYGRYVPVPPNPDWQQQNPQRLLAGSNKQPFNQKDWPAPKLPVWSPPVWTAQHNRQALLATSNKQPFNQKVWPAYQVTMPVQAWQQVNLLENTLSAAPVLLPLPLITQKDWPQPKLAPTPPQAWMQPNQQALLGTSNKKPFNQYDWPAYKATLPAQGTGQQDLSTNTLLPIVASVLPFNQYDWKAAPQAALQIQAWQAQNVLVNYPEPGGPPGPYDWGGLAGPEQRQTFDSVNLLPTLLSTVQVTTPPFNQTDWPGYRPLGQSTPGWQYSYEPLLASSNAVPFRQQDWPGPKQTTQIPAWQSVNLLVTYPAQITAPPFQQTDWPGYRDVTWRSDTNVPNLQDGLLATSGLGPFGPFTFGGSLDAATFPQPFFEQNLLTSTLSAPVVTGGPPGPYDWGNIGTAESRQTFDAVNLLTNTLAAPPPPVPPIAQYDWPLPRVATYSYAGYTQNLLESTLPTSSSTPFVQSDWQTPQQFPPAALFWTNNLLESTLYQPPVPLPPNQYDWPNPQQIRQPAAQYSWVNIALPNTPPAPPVVVVTTPQGGHGSDPLDDGVEPQRRRELEILERKARERRKKEAEQSERELAERKEIRREVAEAKPEATPAVLASVMPAYVEQPKKKKKPEADAISDAEAMMIAIILAMDDD